MIWLFVILGLVGMASALYGLGMSVRARRGVGWQLLAAVLFVFAWKLGHEQRFGWTALVVGMLTTLVGHQLRRTADASDATSKDPHAESSRPNEGVQSPDGQTPDAARSAVDDQSTRQATGKNQAISQSQIEISSPPPLPPPPPLASWVLLTDPWQFVPDVFLASLRRCGERTARMEKPLTGGRAARFAVGRVILELEYHPSTAELQTIEEAAAQSWAWPQALASARSHAARIRFTTHVDRYEQEGEASRRGVLLLHGLAHRALAEFAPVSAIYWPDAGRLLSPEAAPGGSAEDSAIALASSTEVNFRTFPLEGSEAGRYVCDSMGMDALGLVDMQVTVDGEPDDEVSRALYALAARQLESGMPPEDGLVWPADAPPRWQLRRAVARFGRSREVLLLEPIKQDDSIDDGTSAGDASTSDPTP